MFWTLDTHPRRFITSTQRATRFCYGDEQGVYVLKHFICCCCAFGLCAWFHPPELRELIHEAESPEILKLESADSVSI